MFLDTFYFAYFYREVMLLKQHFDFEEYKVL